MEKLLARIEAVYPITAPLLFCLLTGELSWDKSVSRLPTMAVSISSISLHYITDQSTRIRFQLRK
jgi:hypothetical protein